MHWKIPRWILVIAAGAVCAKVIRELMSALDSPPKFRGTSSSSWSYYFFSKHPI